MQDSFDIITAEFLPRIRLTDVDINLRASVDSTCFAATVLLDDERVADAMNHGNGGGNRYGPPEGVSWGEGDAYSKWDSFVKQVGARYEELEGPSKMGTDGIVDIVVGTALDRYSRAQRWCTSVLFRYEDMGHEDYYAVSAGKLPQMWETAPKTARRVFFNNPVTPQHFSDRDGRAVKFLNDESKGIDAWFNIVDGDWAEVPAPGSIEPVAAVPAPEVPTP